MSIEENVHIVKDFFAAIGGNRQNLLALASVGRKSEAPSATFTRIGATGEDTGVKGESALSPPTLDWEQKMAEGAALFRPTTDTYIILHAQCRLSGKPKNHVNGVNERIAAGLLTAATPGWKREGISGASFISLIVDDGLRMDVGKWSLGNALLDSLFNWKEMEA